MVTPEQGLIDLEKTYKKEVDAGWEFIRKLAAYVDAFGPAYYYQVADHMGLSPKTLRNYASLARNPISEYAEDLGLTRQHASAVLGLPDEEARTLLLQAAEDGLSDDWLRYEARNRNASRRQDAPEKEQRLMNTAMLDRTETPNSNGNVQTHSPTTYNATLPVPVAHTALYDGATQNRKDGKDPYMGVVVAEAEPDDVPFSHYDMTLQDDDTPFDVAERIVAARGVDFARKVAEEITRWGNWG